jgi:PAS domain S-box-containing protein
MIRKESSMFGPSSSDWQTKTGAVCRDPSEAPGHFNGASMGVVHEAEEWRWVFQATAEAIHQAATMEELFRLVVQALRKMMPCDAASLVVRSADAKFVQTQFVAREGQMMPVTARMPLRRFARLIKMPAAQSYRKDIPAPLWPLLFPDLKQPAPAEKRAGVSTPPKPKGALGRNGHLQNQDTNDRQKPEDETAATLQKKTETPPDEVAEMQGPPSTLLVALKGMPFVPVATASQKTSGIFPEAQSVIAPAVSSSPTGGFSAEPAEKEMPSGCIAVASHQAEAFTANHGELLAALADLLVAGIHKVRLMHEKEHTLKSLRCLAEASWEMGTARDLDTAMQKIAQAAVRALPVPYASVALCDLTAPNDRGWPDAFSVDGVGKGVVVASEHANSLPPCNKVLDPHDSEVTHAAGLSFAEMSNAEPAAFGSGASPTDWPPCPLRMSNGLIKRLLRNRPIMVTDVPRSHLFSDAVKMVMLRYGIKYYFGVPILLRHCNGPDAGAGAPVSLAILGIYATNHEGFDEVERTVLQVLAAQAVQVLENNRLYQQVKKSRDYFEGLLLSSVDAIVTTDRRGNIIFFSPGAENLLGYRALEMPGQPVTRLLRDGSDKLRRSLLNLLRKGDVQHCELDIINSDKETIPLSISISRVLNGRGTVEGFLCIGKDISQRRAAELEIKRRGEELENFVYVISHNLKTPIVSIQGFANLLQEELGPMLDSDHLHFLDRIQKNAALMEKMILDLLEFSRLGRSPVKFEMVNVKEVVQGVIDEMFFLGKIRDVEFTWPRKPLELPRVYADGAGLKTIFENLLNNAVKYRRPGVPLRIEIGWEEQTRFHVFWVRDNGMGMEAGFLAKAFDLFQRGPNVGQIQGTGVGLAIVRRIVENHKGLVRLDSKPGEGTTIYFTLPKLDALPVSDLLKLGPLPGTSRISLAQERKEN